MPDDPPSIPPPPDATQTLASIAPDRAAERRRRRVRSPSRGDPLRPPAAGYATALGARAVAGPRREPADAARVARAARGARPASRRATARGPSWPRGASAAGLEMLGTLVRGLKLADPAWHDLVRSALEVRRILAAEAVALAAERHTEEDLARSPPARRCCASTSTTRVRVRARRPRVHACGVQGRAQRRARALSQHVCAMARRPPAARDDALRRLRVRGRALSGGHRPDSRRATAERRALISRQVLEALDEAWSRRHPPPPPIAVPDLVTMKPPRVTRMRKERRRA